MEIIQKISMLWVPFACLTIFFLIRYFIYLSRLSSKYNVHLSKNRLGMVKIIELKVAQNIVEDPLAKEMILKIASAKKGVYICLIIVLFFLVTPWFIRYWLF